MYNNIFKPIKINSLMFSNRILAAPISGVMLPEKGQSGAAVNIVGCINVDCPSGDWFNSGYPFGKYNCERTRTLLDIAKSGGSYACAEIHHVGLWAMNENAVGPQDGTNERGGTYRQATREDLEEIANAYAKTCVDAKEFGFDMCMLHFAHGWLMMQFLSPGRNHRNDEFGGSYENRSRFPLEVLRRVRKAVGKDFPIDMRISAHEWVENGIEIEDVIHFINDASEYIDMVNVSVGSDMDKLGAMHLTASQFEPHCCNKEYAKKIKENVNIPVAVVGSIETPQEADDLIANGYCDMVTIGRALIADPYWIKKAYLNMADDIVPCLRCNNCEHWSTERRLKGCSVNPRVYRENFVDKDIKKADTKKKVVVIGGGPAGMRAALVAYERGHEVEIYEKEPSLGGKLNLFKKIPSKQDLVSYGNYLKRQIEKKNIKTYLNVSADYELIKNEKPDAVIIAIGSDSAKLKIEGVENSIDALTAYQNIDAVKNSVVIIGGGTVGCELAIDLAKKGKDVTIIERSERLHKQVSLFLDLAIDEQLRLNKNIHIYKNTNVVRITNDSVEIMNDKKETKVIKTEQSIIAIGFTPKHQESYKFYQLDCPVYMIGDCLKVGKIKDTTDSAYFTASNI